MDARLASRLLVAGVVVLVVGGIAAAVLVTLWLQSIAA